MKLLFLVSRPFILPKSQKCFFFLWELTYFGGHGIKQVLLLRHVMWIRLQDRDEGRGWGRFCYCGIRCEHIRKIGMRGVAGTCFAFAAFDVKHIMRTPSLSAESQPTTNAANRKNKKIRPSSLSAVSKLTTNAANRKNKKILPLIPISTKELTTNAANRKNKKNSPLIPISTKELTTNAASRKNKKILPLIPINTKEPTTNAAKLKQKIAAPLIPISRKPTHRQCRNAKAKNRRAPSHIKTPPRKKRRFLFYFRSCMTLESIPRRRLMPRFSSW